MIPQEIERNLKRCGDAIDKAQDQNVKGYGTAVAIGALTIAVESLRDIVAELVKEQKQTK